MKKVFIVIVSLAFTLYSAIPLPGQSVIRGRVTDRETGEPLAFVNIVYNERGTGTTTSLDGFFTIETGMQPEFLKLSYVGYEPVTVYPGEGPVGFLNLVMTRKPYLIEEVTVLPGINPAHRIIEKAFGNRRLNNPEMLPSFSYKSYNKLYFTLVHDSLVARVSLPGDPALSRIYAGPGSNRAETITDEGDEAPGAAEQPVDSGRIRMEEFFEKQHLFLMESVSERQYRRPGRNNERVTASRVSGFRDPSFTLLATQLQSFSFYGDFISLLDRNYLSPLSRGSISRYSFILEDSMFTERNDTLFIISFRPYPNRNFDGLQGVVYINSNRYAVQNVIAEPFERRGIFNIRIRQNYTFVDNRQWFPAELNTDIILGRDGDGPDGPADRFSLVGIGKSYLSDIVIEPELRRRHFNNIELTVAPDAHRRPDEYWNEYRVEPLSDKDVKTYHVIDSIGREVNLDRSLTIFEAMATGYIPWGIVNVDYAGLLDYNYFEGLRPGIRILTNDRVSESFRLGGYAAFGSRDGTLKYGGEAGITLYRPADAKLRFSWSRDVEEAGSYSFLEKHSVYSSESYRRFMIGRMDFVENYDVSLGFRFIRHFKGSLYYSGAKVRSGDNYHFLREGVERDEFIFPEAGARIRFAWREKFMQTPRGNRISMGTDFPVIWFNYGRGLGDAGGYEYTRMQAGLYQGFVTRHLGRTSVTIEGGIVEGEVPLFKLYNGKGSFRGFSLEAANSFATMRMEEFFSDRFVSVFFRQNFESLLFRSGRFRPEVVFVTNAGFGSISETGNHLFINVKAPKKGFYESGLLLNNLYRKFFTGFGLGVFYRYGPYGFEKPVDNFAFKLTFGVSLR
jgi:hypothetical protein